MFLGWAGSAHLCLEGYQATGRTAARVVWFAWIKRAAGAECCWVLGCLALETWWWLAVVALFLGVPDHGAGVGFRPDSRVTFFCFAKRK